MQTKKVFSSKLLVAVFACLFFAGCGGNDGDYQGVGKLVSDRNSARLAKDSDKKKSEGSGTSVPSEIKEGGQPREVLIEEEVKVVGLSSGKVLARGIVFLDKNGKVISIRIRKN